MKLSGLLCPLALVPQADTNVPVEALRPPGGSATFGATPRRSTKSDADGPPRSVWQSGGFAGLGGGTDGADVDGPGLRWSPRCCACRSVPAPSVPAPSVPAPSVAAGQSDRPW